MEEQKEEFEVLDAIYGEDSKFTVLSETHFQYKYGEEGEESSFVLDITWPDSYPCVGPKFGLDSFYNSFIPQALKVSLLGSIVKESDNNLGNVQTYNMIEWVRENREALFVSAKLEQPAESKKFHAEQKVEDKETAGGSTASPKKKSEQLTKSQKRKEWDKKDAKGEAVRGGDWVDIVKHLSQTGYQQEDPKPNMNEPKT